MELYSNEMIVLHKVDIVKFRNYNP